MRNRLPGQGNALRNRYKCMLGPNKTRMGRRGYLANEPAENIIRLIRNQEPFDIRMFNLKGLRGKNVRRQTKGLEALLANAVQKGDMFTVREKPLHLRGNHYLLHIRP